MKVISFCLWGKDPKYNIGAIKNAELLSEIYPGWVARYYCGQSTSKTTIKKIQEIENNEIIMMDEEGDWRGMFWRFYPASEPDVDVMISRDTDSRLNMREKLAVDEWLESDKSFHIMRDHPWHGAEILGGMWGVRGDILKDMKKMIEEYDMGDFWQVDQNFLKQKIYNIIKDDVMVHDEFHNYNINKKPFPSKREGKQFVGEAFDYMGEPNKQHRNMIK